MDIRLSVTLPDGHKVSGAVEYGSDLDSAVEGMMKLIDRVGPPRKKRGLFGGFFDHLFVPDRERESGIPHEIVLALMLDLLRSKQTTASKDEKATHTLPDAFCDAIAGAVDAHPGMGKDQNFRFIAWRVAGDFFYDLRLSYNDGFDFTTGSFRSIEDKAAWMNQFEVDVRALIESLPEIASGDDFRIHLHRRDGTYTKALLELAGKKA